jgi:hypothetical protein
MTTNLAERKMSKFPLLEQLRFDRQRREDEITAPIREVADTLDRRLRGATESLRAIERMLGTEMGKRVLEQIGAEMVGAIRRHIFEACAKAHEGGDSHFTLNLPLEIMRFTDPRSIESDVLRRYANEAMPDLRLSALPMDREMSVTTVDIRIPPLSCRQAIVN